MIASNVETHIGSHAKRRDPAIPGLVEFSRLIEQDAQPDLSIGIDNTGAILIPSEIQERLGHLLVGRPGVRDEAVLVGQVVGKDVLFFGYRSGVLGVEQG